jgi:hypothetical protein
MPLPAKMKKKTHLPRKTNSKLSKSSPQTWKLNSRKWKKIKGKMKPTWACAARRRRR